MKENIKTDGKILVYIKIYNKDLNSFEKALGDIMRYPPYTSDIFWKYSDNAFFFRFEIDVLLLACFLRRVLPILKEELNNEVLWYDPIEKEPELLLSSSCILMLGLETIDSVSKIKHYIDKVLGLTLETFSEQAFSLI